MSFEFSTSLFLIALAVALVFVFRHYVNDLKVKKQELTAAEVKC